jgi:RNA polymerase primary sigma factor
MDTRLIFIRELRRRPMFGRDAQRELLVKAKAGDIEARNALVATNLPYVIKLATRLQRTGADFEDLVQAGAMGLMHAVDKFDTSRPVAFLSYGSYWAHHYIRRHIADHGKVIRISNHAQWRPNNEKVKAAVAAVNEVLSLSEPGQAGVDVDCGGDPHDLAAIADERAALDAYVAMLSPQEQDVLRRRAGGCQLVAIGECYGVSRERIRQIEKVAMGKLAIKFGVSPTAVSSLR